jgi:adenylate cyclase
MFTDMVGYTALGQRNESLSLALVEEQRKLIRPTLERHNGREVKTMGDAFLVEFSSALDAVMCAYDIQRATKEFNVSLPEERRIHLRVGVHLGDVVESQGDISGDAVNIASRIEPLAEDGGVCLTRQVYDQIQNKFELQMASLGIKTLKNVSVPVEVYKIAMPWGEGAAVSQVRLDSKRIAVLPFTNMSTDPADVFFADGLTEELISTMSKIRELSVISRTSVMQYRNQSKSVSEIGRELNAGTILEGSIRKAGNRLRVSAQMIDATQDKHLWAENYDREVQDIFLVQSDIADRVAQALRVHLLAPEKEEISKAPTKSPGAHTLYLKGSYFAKGLDSTPADIEKGIEYFKLAVDQDPDFALAYAMLSECHIDIADESMPAVQAFPKAKEFAAKAVSLNAKLAEAHYCLAGIAFQHDWDWPLADTEFRRAVDLNPSHADAHAAYATFLTAMGRFDESIRERRAQQDLDPLSPWIGSGISYWVARNNEKARETWQRALEKHPNNPRAHAHMALLNAVESKTEAALKEVEALLRISGESLFQEYAAWTYAILKMEQKALDIVQGLLSNKYRGYASPMGISAIYYLLGDKDEGFEWIHKAYEVRSAALPYTNNWPIMDRAREDSRFLELLAKMKLQ